jgi:hypothetical protein
MCLFGILGSRFQQQNLNPIQCKTSQTVAPSSTDHNNKRINLKEYLTLTYLLVKMFSK